MNILRKITTAIRGGSNEIGEAIVDSQALRILDQEIRDADHELSLAKNALAEIMAKHRISDRQLELKKTKAHEYESFALEALAKEKNALAEELAEKIAVLSAEITDEQKLVEEMVKNEEMLRSTIAQTETNLKRLKGQVDTVRATESVQKAQAAVALRFSGTESAMTNALDSLERLKQRQEERSARFQAAQELASANDEATLDAKLKAAGIKSTQASKADVLERLKAMTAGNK